MMKNKDFCVFILTHGRAGNIVTLKTLKACGYTGEIYLIVDNEDKTIDQYHRIYGKDMVIVFDKKLMADQTDEGNNFDERRTITHARNITFSVAEKLGIDYFIQLDDDYTGFHHRYIDGEKLAYENVRQLNNIFDAMIEFVKNTGCHTLAMGQGGDFIGGKDGSYKTMLGLGKRKAMNSFLCSTKNRFQFIGAMNEDVNTYTTLGSRGYLFFTTVLISLVQKQTQAQEGGITDMYKLYGTYCKAFTTTMMSPSSVKVSIMQSNHPRIHHKINWKVAVPVIISEDYKK